MRRKLVVILCVILITVIAASSIFWALHLNSAINNFRSPITNNPPQPGEPSGDPLTRRVVFVLVDGLREDLAYDEELMPVFNSLKSQGASATMHVGIPSLSTPAYGVLMTGAWPYLSDAPAMNLDYEDIPVMTQDNIFSAAARNGMKTALSGYNWFEKLIPASDLTDGFFTPGEDEAADLDVMAAALPWLDDPAYQLVLIHIDQIDHMEHVYGALSAETKQATANADAYIAEILAKLNLEQDTLLVCGDHGHIDQGGHAGPEAIVTQVPFVLIGAGIQPGMYADINQVDVAPTIAALLGTNLPASAQGKVRTEMLYLTGTQLRTITDATEAQQTKLADAVETALSITVERNSAGIPLANAIETAMQARLRTEQLPRLLTVIAVLLFVIALFIWRKPGHLLKILVAVAIFLLVFNLSYRFILGNTYSFSSIKSISNLIITYSLMCLAGLLLAGGLLTWWSKVKPTHVTRFSKLIVSFLLILQLVLFIPGLVYYVLVGKTIAWALPHITTQFWSLHSLLQVTFSGVIGLLLLGITLLVARIFKKKKVST
jgi:hypothetical protein